MKILRLETRNLASLEGDNCIDFDSGILGSTQMFCIVGPTGSGKSTILDAICLPLYGNAPRYPMQKRKRARIEVIGTAAEDEKNSLAPTDPRNILTKGQKDGYSKLTFTANDGKTYRAEWSVHKKTKKYANAETSLVCIERDEKGLPVEHARNWEDLPDKIIGLDFDQFLRTVLIAQGSFASFLNAQADERMSLLERLVGNEGIYLRFAEEVKERKSAALEAYNKISAQTEANQKKLLDDEALTNVKDRLAALNEREKTLNDQLRTLDEHIKWYKADDEMTQDTDRKKEQLSKAQAANDSAAAERRHLTLHDETTVGIGLYRDMASRQKTLKAAENQAATTEKQIQQQSQQLSESKAKGQLLEAAAAKTKEALEQMRPHIDRAKQLVVQIADRQKTESDKAKNLRDAQRRQHEAAKAVKANTKSIQKEEFTEKTLLKNLIDTKKSNQDQMLALTDAFEKAKDIYEAANSTLLKKDPNALRARKDEATNSWHDATKALDIVAGTEQAKIKLQENAAVAKHLYHENEQHQKTLENLNIDCLKKEIDTLTKVQMLMASKDLSHLRPTLEDGKPCPLCGATHHPYADSEEVAKVVDESEQLIKSKQQVLDQQTLLQKKCCEALAVNKEKLTNLEKDNAKQKQTIAEQTKRWNEIAPKHPSWQPDKPTLEALLPQLEKAEANAKKALDDYDRQAKLVGGLRDDKDKKERQKNNFDSKAKEAIALIDKQLTACKTHLDDLHKHAPELATKEAEASEALNDAKAQIEKCQKEIAELRQQLLTELGGKDPQQLEKQLTDACNQAAQAAAKHQQQQGNLQEAISKLHGSQNTLTDNIEKAKLDLSEATEKLAAWIADYNAIHEAITETDLLKLASDTTDWETMRKKLHNLTTALTEARTALNIAEENHQKHQATKPEASMETIKDCQQKTSAEALAIRKDAIPLQTQLQNHNDALREMGDMAEKLNAAKQLRADWTEISDAIGGDGKTLRRMVQCYTLGFLVNHANAELRRFNNRYELQQVKNSLGLRIVDHDRADEVRDTTSLSGGETFIVSLGLALGLSSLSSRNVHFDNFFIDEGFGTLDPDALATVIDALATLQSAQGKKVGVISHTDTMSERITTQIRVVKEGATGKSHIEISGS